MNGSAVESWSGAEPSGLSSSQRTTTTRTSNARRRGGRRERGKRGKEQKEVRDVEMPNQMTGWLGECGRACCCCCCAPMCYGKCSISTDETTWTSTSIRPKDQRTPQNEQKGPKTTARTTSRRREVSACIRHLQANHPHAALGMPNMPMPTPNQTYPILCQYTFFISTPVS